MYKTLYKSLNRLKTYDDAIKVKLTCVSTDLFLYLIDLYDLLIKTDIQPDQYRLLSSKLKMFMLKAMKRIKKQKNS